VADFCPSRKRLRLSDDLIAFYQISDHGMVRQQLSKGHSSKGFSSYCVLFTASFFLFSVAAYVANKVVYKQ